MLLVHWGVKSHGRGHLWFLKIARNWKIVFLVGNGQGTQWWPDSTTENCHLLIKYLSICQYCKWLVLIAREKSSNRFMFQYTNQMQTESYILLPTQIFGSSVSHSQSVCWVGPLCRSASSDWSAMFRLCLLLVSCVLHGFQSAGCVKMNLKHDTTCSVSEDETLNCRVWLQGLQVQMSWQCKN